MSAPFPKPNPHILNVYLNRAASEETFEKVRHFLEDTMTNNPLWQGMRFRIYNQERFTWVGEDSQRAGMLHKAIREILMAQDFEHPEMIV